MKKLLLALLLIPSIVSGQSAGFPLLTGTSQVGILDAFANEAITIDSTAGGVAFTTATISPTCTDCPINVLRATRADCTSETSAFLFRVTTTGTAPTTAVGTLITAGASFTVYGYVNIAAFRAIRTAGTSIAMYCVYSRPYQP